jgi:ATP-binding cassette subfamily B protein
LLFRFFDPQSGRILVNGQPIDQVDLESVRRIMGVVPQDTSLFNQSIRYNIAYGRPGASMEEIKEAARKAQLHDLIESLPDGYETMVGERGMKLSGTHLYMFYIMPCMNSNILA